MPRRPTRRRFLKTAALTGVGYWVAGGVRAAESKSPNERVQFACIGVGGKGGGDSRDAHEHGKVVAICDTDQKALDKHVRRHGKVRQFHDFRKLFDQMHAKIDAVTVTTPDHTHAVIAAMAMRLGKHCFCQKPLAHSLFEVRTLAAIARQMKVATQMGNQGTASSQLRRGAALVRTGALGKITEIHVSTDRPKWSHTRKRPKAAPVPANIKWDLWIGPAPFRDYAPGYHPEKWRGWWDFGTGALGDMGCHMINLPFMALDLREPESVEAESSGHNHETYPSWSKVRWQFPARGDRPAVPMFWYDGGKLPPRELGGGSVIVGTKGRLVITDQNGSYRLAGGAQEQPVEFPKSPGHFTEWVGAIKGGPPAMSNFPDYAGPLTETVLLGNLALWSGKKIEWDAKNLKVKGQGELDPIIKPKYRAGYSL